MDKVYVPVRNKISSRSSSTTAEHSSKQKISDTVKKKNHVKVSDLKKRYLEQKVVEMYPYRIIIFRMTHY